ncbi:hypothetical protein QR680_014910 [Steinernema hermaphroditum]|uniref:Uncharacterized protein n=1 Tax=Steinernema hermaphroditum TaxID=289476 RepID=A0AA39ICN8_9BILA|nr:hypothetical protein QR680_014910 [Steinernema hermaphroditum]
MSGASRNGTLEVSTRQKIETNDKTLNNKREMSEGSIEDTTEQYEQMERDVEKMVKEGGRPNDKTGEFTRWARNEDILMSRMAHSVRDFPKSFENTQHEQKFLTSTPLEGKASKRFFPSADVESIERISARSTPSAPCGRRLHAVAEENEPTQSTQEDEEAAKKLKKATSMPKKEKAPEESVHPLSEQLRSLIQLLDIQQIEMRKRQEQYFRQMQDEVEARREKLKAERTATDLEFRRREKALTEREKRVNRDESDKLAEMKERLKREIDLKNERSVENHKLRAKIAELEAAAKVFRRPTFLQRRSSLEAVRSNQNYPVLSRPPAPRKVASERWSAMKTKKPSTAKPEGPVSERPSSFDENESTRSLDQETSLSPALNRESLACGCTKYTNGNGVFREWRHSDGTMVMMAQDPVIIELFAPNEIKLTFDAMGAVYVLLPDRTGFVLFSDGQCKIGRYLDDTVEGRGRFRVEDIKGIECYKYDEDGTIGWTGCGIALRCAPDWSKVVIGKVTQFIYVRGKTVYVNHIDDLQTPRMKTLCFQHMF